MDTPQGDPGAVVSRVGVAVPVVTTVAMAAIGFVVSRSLPSHWVLAIAAGGTVLAWLCWFALSLRRGVAPSPAPTVSAAASPPAAAVCQTLNLEEKRAAMLEGELAAAREIQMRLVPHTFPPIPGCPPFDLFATIEPAKEIGGDFYDFWLIGKERLAMVIADVSGKGVPAALFMAMTRTYLRAFSRYIREPAELLERLNREVSKHNPGCMFVTVFCGMVELTTGKMDYANAGHNPPYRKKEGASAVAMDVTENPPVGFVPGIKYERKRTQLEPGEMLLLYTDGITEAMNEGREMLGDAQALAMFARAAEASSQCRGVLSLMGEGIGGFTGAADQYDDMTMLAYRQAKGSDAAADGGGAAAAVADGDDILNGDSALSSLAGSTLFRTMSGSGKDVVFSLSDLKDDL